MPGEIVYTPPPPAGRHECSPPWDPPSGPQPLVARPNPSVLERRGGRGKHHDTHVSMHPSGTVWECDCGTTWVSGRGQWRREGRFARWRRERRLAAAQAAAITAAWEAVKARPGVVLLPPVNADPDALPPSAAIAPPTPHPGVPGVHLLENP